MGAAEVLHLLTYSSFPAEPPTSCFAGPVVGKEFMSLKLFV